MTILFICLAIIFAGACIYTVAQHGRALEALEDDVQLPSFPTARVIQFAVGIVFCLAVAYFARPKPPSEFDSCLASGPETTEHTAFCYNQLMSKKP